ncbi:MAG: hypothetical protein WBA16_03795 [Nonlabens sp.]
MKPVNSIYILLAFLSASCSYLKKDEPVDTVATHLGQHLDRATYNRAYDKANKDQDSLSIAREIIEEWLINTALLNNANLNLTQERKDEVTDLVNAYRSELLIQDYLSQLTKQKLDTTIVDSVVSNYYDDYKNQFVLNEDLVKYKYLHVGKRYQDLKTLKKWFGKEDSINKLKIDSLKLSFKDYQFNDSVWYRKRDLFDNILPVDSGNEDNFLLTNRVQSIEDSTGVYLLKIYEVLDRGETAPLPFVRPTIVQIIENRRKLDFIKKLKTDLLNEIDYKKIGIDSI